MAIRNSWVLGLLLCQKSYFTCTNCLGSIRLRDCLHLTGALLQLYLQRNGSFSVLEHISEWQSNNPELRQESALPLQKGNIEGPPTHISFLEVTSYTNTRAPFLSYELLPFHGVWGMVMPQPRTSMWCVNKTDLCLPQCPWHSSAGLWKQCMVQLVHGYPTSSVTHPKYVCKSWDTFAMTQHTCCLSVTFAVSKDILVWCHPVCPLLLSNASSITEALSDVFGLGTQPGISQSLGFLSRDECWGIFTVTSEYRERKDYLPAGGTKKWCPHWGWNLKSRCL